ncbi:uncharacterized protein LOC135692067 isoform X2 [Rhopilema esculentum]|uniref:uncharacterized protein LOC135692067 isoform X2 n=1 Tax=Rhopilema esculentum TaxID=499914 RepID=UPI0031DACC98|eukprot:gene5270-419_t
MQKGLSGKSLMSLKRKLPSDIIRTGLIIANVVLSLMIIHLIVDIYSTLNTSPPEVVKSSETNCKCKDILGDGSIGSWVRGHTSERLRYLPPSKLTDREIRRQLFLPDQIYRNDLRCGWDNPLVDFTLPAACDPDSHHFCCNEKFGWCGNTTDHCQQEGSVDFKKLVPTNEAVWKPTSNECKLVEFSPKDACNLMSKNQINLIFMGDSEARKFLTAFLLLLTGDIEKGVLRRDISDPQFESCHWELQLLNEDCHTIVEDSSIRLEDPDSCGYNNAFLVEYYPDFDTFLTSRTTERIKSLFKVKNTYIIFNGGVHFNANSQAMLNYYLRYVVDLLKDQKWPKLIVETLPKTPSVVLSDQRRRFKNAIVEFCSKHKIPVFDNFELGTNLQSYDGKHFSLPYYMQKVHILLGYLKETTEPCSL